MTVAERMPTTITVPWRRTAAEPRLEPTCPRCGGPVTHREVGRGLGRSGAALYATCRRPGCFGPLRLAYPR